MSEYTKEIVANMVATYEANPTPETVASLAETVGKTVNSVRAKLSSLGVYKAQKKVTATKGNGVTKTDLVKVISAFVGTDVATLSKANKADLEALVETFKSMDRTLVELSTPEDEDFPAEVAAEVAEFTSVEVEEVA